MEDGKNGKISKPWVSLKNQFFVIIKCFSIPYWKTNCEFIDYLQQIFACKGNNLGQKHTFQPKRGKMVCGITYYRDGEHFYLQFPNFFQNMICVIMTFQIPSNVIHFYIPISFFNLLQVDMNSFCKMSLLNFL